MNINFKKISAVITGLMTIGLTMGAAAAANYPAPFVAGGVANVAIVQGTGAGVSQLDGIQAGFTSTDLQRYLSGGGGGTDTTTAGEVESLDTSSTRIWLNTSFDAAKTQFTKSHLPTILADYTFAGDSTSKLTHTIKIPSGAAAGGANSGKVIFAKQPESGDDPVIGVSLGTSASQPLYNATVSMGAINFTHADTQGEEIELFGQTFTISSDSDSTKIVLLKEAQSVTLTNDNPSTTVTIGGSDYTIELVSSSDDAASIKVTDSSGASSIKSVSESSSKTIQGLDIAVKTADENNFALTATLIVGAEKMTFTDGTVVTTGENDDPIDGTKVYITGGTTATTELAIAVYAPDSSNDAILEGETFTDPVFGSFKIDFAGLSSSLDDEGRETISILPSGQKDMTITMMDSSSNEKTFTFAHNESSQWRLADSSNYSIAVKEMANLSYASGQNRYIMIGNEEEGHLLELYDVYNQTTGTSSVTNDRVKFRDVIDGETYATTFTSTEGSGTLSVGGKSYTVTFVGTGENAGVTLKYPTSEDDGSHGAGDIVVFPTIKTKNGGLVALYEPQTLSLSAIDGGTQEITKLVFPDGDEYTAATFTYVGNESGGVTADDWNITYGSTTETLDTEGAGYVDFTIGQLTYNITGVSSSNSTKLYLTDPEGTANIDNPGVIFLEGKDDNTEYHTIVVDLEDAPAGTSNDGVGVEDVLFSSNTHWEETQATDSDVTEHVDWFGTHVSYDASDSSQAKTIVSYPSSQIYAQLFVGEESATITAGTTGTTGSSSPLGEVVIMDSEVGSAADKNLIVIGGSCINSAAAALVGGAYCGADWTEATEIAAGQFMIKGYKDNTLTSELALLVAGYNPVDTVNAAKYLRTQTVDTSMNYKGTSATSADLVTTTA